MLKASCIIVCYRPDAQRLRELCARIVADGAAVILVDNTEQPYLDRNELPEGSSLITLGYNSGIAHAQNAGITAPLGNGAGALVFFDQDSRIASGFVSSLVAALNEGVAEVVAPLCVDEVANVPLPSLRVS